MNVQLKIASVALFLLGSLEILGALLLSIAPAEFVPAEMLERKHFWMTMSTIYGISRIVAGHATWMRKKWGIAFGMVLSVAAVIVAPLIYPFGILDVIFGPITLACLLFVWFGNERL